MSGDPSQPPEQPILAEAAKTWHGEWWKDGGGGTVWEGLSYDPELNLIYFGVGIGSNGTRAIAARARVTIGSCPRSWRSTPTPAPMHATTRPRLARSGTSTQCNS